VLGEHVARVALAEWNGDGRGGWLWWRWRCWDCRQEEGCGLGASMGLCGLMMVMHPDCSVELTNLPKLQDLMRLNVKRNYGKSSLSGQAIVLCHVLRWGADSDYAGAPYNVLVRANIVVLPYDPVALARTFNALSGPWTRVYVSGKA
jgi:hypothetical protein